MKEITSFNKLEKLIINKLYIHPIKITLLKLLISIDKISKYIHHNKMEELYQSNHELKLYQNHRLSFINKNIQYHKTIHTFNLVFILNQKTLKHLYMNGLT